LLKSGAFRANREDGIGGGETAAYQLGKTPLTSASDHRFHNAQNKSARLAASARNALNLQF